MEAAEEKINATLTHFTERYLIAFTLNLVGHVKAELKDESSNTPSLELTEAEPSTVPIMQGWIVKQGAIHKTWKRRYARMMPDYSIEYYADEYTEGKKNKMKGIIHPCGYTFHQTVEDKAMAKKRPLSMCLSHPARREYYLAAETEEDKELWVRALQTAVLDAQPPIDRQPLMVDTFTAAYSDTRRHCKYVDGGKVDCDEATLLEELLTDFVKRDMGEDLYLELPTDEKKRAAAMKKTDDLLSKLIANAVQQCLKTLNTQVATRKKVEKGIRKKLKALKKGEATLLGDIQDKVRGTGKGAEDALQPHLDMYVTPAVAQVTRAMLIPVTGAFGDFLREWNHHTYTLIKHVQEEGEASLEHACHVMGPHHFQWLGHDGLKTSTQHLRHMVTPVEHLCPHVTGEEWVCRAFHIMKDLSRNAYLTLESLTRAGVQGGEALKDAMTKATGTVKTRLLHDTQMCMRQYLAESLREVVWRPLQSETVPALTPLVEPLNEKIPARVNQFITIESLLHRYISEAVDAIIEANLTEKAASSIEGLETSVYV
ncbi:niban-like protein [Kipferlia bialata]|uniref:Niban-like protein n=1 Tax=Kipferlia bialata TaxID=797122 RepID=A0A9K3CNX4_9EUKA|nr:niban-like protein [Kipferlia bialata]|eukprot:g343.t1